MTSPGPFRPQFDAAVAAASLQVTKENVLFFRDSIYQECDRLDQALRMHRDTAKLPALGDDPVSHDASRAFSDKIGNLLEQCKLYVDDLRGAAGALDHTARSYGLTEDDITKNFNHAPSPTALPQLSDVDRGRVAVPTPQLPSQADGPRTQILAPVSITTALNPGSAGAV